MRRARFARNQPGGTAAAALAHTSGVEQDDLHAGSRARLRRHGAGHAAADDDHRVGDDAAERRKFGSVLDGNGIKPGGDAVAS